METASTAATAAGGPGWYTCLNTSTIRPAGLLDKIRIAAAAGYQAVELWHDDLDAFLAAGGTLAVVRRALDEAGLAVPDTVHLRDGLAPEQEQYEAALADTRRKLEQAAALGAGHLICGPGSYGDDLPLAIDRYRAFLELGRAYGVLPAVMADTQLRLARAVVANRRLPWERPLDTGRLSPSRVRRQFPQLWALLGSPARPPKPCGRPVSRPKGRRYRPAPRYEAIKLTKVTT